MSEQLFTYAGYSITEQGQWKARFGNDMVSRIKKLTAKNNTETMFYELPEAMTKKEASLHLLEKDEVNSNFEARDALLKVVYRNVPKTTTVVNTSTPGVESTTVVNEGI